MKRKATQRELHTLCHEDEAMYVGSSRKGNMQMNEAPRDPLENRTGGHEREGYSGTVYYTETQNIKDAEDELLKLRSYPYNKYKLSGQQEEPGYVYLIWGRRYKVYPPSPVN